MYQRTLLLIFCIGLFNPIYAQTTRISGEVSSALTQEGVARAVVRLLNADSATVIATDTTRYRLITEKGDNWQNTYADKYRINVRRVLYQYAHHRRQVATYGIVVLLRVC